jgi:hypothetical protein
MQLRQSSRARFRPRPEVLEDRTVPALSFQVIPNGGPGGGAILRITSNRASDSVVINDDGTGNVNNVTVGAFSPGTAISQVVFNGHRGGDQVTYNLTGDLQGTLPVAVPLGSGTAVQAGLPRDVEIHMEKGKDRFVTNFNGHSLLANSDFLLNAGTGRGADNLQVNANQGNGTNVAAGARLRVNLNSFNKRGNDTVTFNYKGQQDGTLNFHLFGGPGSDQLAANVELLAGSTGNPLLGEGPNNPATVNGGPGRDSLMFLVHNDNPSTTSTAPIFAEMHGGAGKDVGVHTANVKAFSVENDMIVP